jgi:hypothetical protein
VSVLLAPFPRLWFGPAFAGYKLFTYLAGTLTKQNTLTDSTGATPNTNPIILDANGSAAVWMTPGILLKFVLALPTDTDPPTIPIWTADNVDGVNDTFVTGINVIQYGADPTGAADSAAAFNNAMTAAVAGGGYQIFIPPGTYTLGSTFILKTGVDVVGSGVNSTILIGKAGTTMDVVQTQNFATLTTTGTAAGPYKFSLRNLTIDGNKAGRSGGRCMSLYGYDFRIEHVQCRNSPVDNVWSEWSSLATVPVAAGGDEMLSHWYDFKSFAAVGNGLDFYGPHDSILTDTDIFINGGLGMVIGSPSGSNGSCVLQGFHSYGNQNLGLQIGANLLVTGSNIQSENNRSVGGIWILATAVVILSDVNCYQNTGYGISNASVDCHLTAVRCTQNSVDGIVNTATGMHVSNYYAANNTGYGLNGVSSNSIFEGVYCQSNLGGGIQIINGAQEFYLSGQSSGNTGTQLVMNTLGSNNFIDMVSFTAAGQTGYSGTPGTFNFINYFSAGNSSQCISQGIVPTTGWATPTGTGVIANFPGATATLAQCSQAIATILTYLKQANFIQN